MSPFARRPRLGVALIALALILVLDLARSLTPRLALLTPVSVWRPDPAIYADMPWPPARATPADASPGLKLYYANCAICHGPDGRGNGPSAPSLIPHPRDFTRAEFEYKSTPADAPPTDDDLYRVIADGLTASAMPGWKALLTEAQIRDLVEVVKSFAPSRPAAAPIAIPEPAPPTPESVARGAKLYESAGCVVCHGPDLRGGVGLEDQKGYPAISRDLTAPWTFRGGSSPSALWLRLTTGLASGPMPSFAETLDPGERWDVVNFVLSRQRIAPWATGGELAGPGHAANLERRGRYLVRAEMCGLCHTEIDAGLIYRDDRYLAGGMRVGGYPHGVFVSRNLTSDAATGLGDWTETQVANALRDGRARDGRVLDFWAMSWMYFHRFGDDDAIAIARYLKTLPAVHNAIPDALHYGFVETIFEKLVDDDLPAAPAPRLTYAVGSYANESGVDAALVETWLVRAQWAALAFGLVGFVFAAPAGQRLPKGVGGYARATLALAGLAVVIGAGAFLYLTPALSLLPPDKIFAAAAGSIPEPDLGGVAPEKAAMIRRGQYLYTVASCALCHENGGSGGDKVSDRRSGTQFAANLTSDRTAGLGAWSDAEIARAIRSGVGRDGRPLYWQAMPWDHFSNWDEEDVRSIIAYLRTLPPIAEPSPADAPPSPADCEIYTFFIVKTQRPGCAM